jgi:hypothetical protein
MRVRLLAVLFAAALAALNVSSVFASTGGGGGTDLGLESITISGGTVIAKTGQVTLAGSVTCTQDLDASVSVDLAQVVGRLNTIRGSGFTSVSCLAAVGSASFTVSFFADFGKFAPGSARVDAFAETGFCNDVDCFFDDAAFGPASIRLVGSRG